MHTQTFIAVYHHDRSMTKKVDNPDIPAKRHANNGLDNAYVKQITKFLSS